MSIRLRSATGLLVTILVSLMAVTLATAFRSHQQDTLLTDAYLRGIMSHLSDKMLSDAPEGYLDYPLSSYEDIVPSSKYDQPESDMMKEYEDNLSETMPRERLGLSLRDQEYLKHSSLFSGHRDDVVADLPSSPVDDVPAKPTSLPGNSKNDNVLPAYCNPPNPCPVGYTAEDGCLEEFENTAAFSREYQAAQDCMCDTEHMFDCPASLGNKKNMNAKSRATANMVDTAIRKIMVDFQGEHKNLVSKKFFTDKYYGELTGLKERAHKAAEMAGQLPQPVKENPYLQGDKLPIAAKKGNHAAA